MNQRYIVFIPGHDPYFTEWISRELFPEVAGAVVVNWKHGRFTKDGVHWNEMEEDHL